jgi:DNA-binding response OmpR family regulator
LATFTYRDVRMVMGDPDTIFSGNVIDALKPRGLREPAVCRNVESLRSALGHTVDLLVCDVDLPGLDFCALAQDIRHGRLGINPFTVLIATARPSTGTDLGRVFSSGIDYIVLKPMTADLVVRRVDGFTRSRKPFVVTDDFIGPSRRTKRRNDGSDDDLTPVPNTLRVKVLHNDRVALMPKLMEIGMKRLGKKKEETQIKAIGRLTHRLGLLQEQPAYRDNMGEWRNLLSLLGEKSDSVVALHKGAQTDHAAEIAVRIGKLARRWSDAKARPPEIEVMLMAQLAEALAGAFAQSDDIPDIARQIAAMVDGFLDKDGGEEIAEPDPV